MGLELINNSYRGDELLEEALDNFGFQRWTMKAGFTVRDSQTAIEQFREHLETVNLSYRKLQVLEAFEPYGYLSTYERARRFSQDPSLSTVMCKISMQKSLPLLGDSAISFRGPEAKNGNKIRGLGCWTILTPIEFVIAYLIPWDESGETISLSELADRIYGTPDDTVTTKIHAHYLRKKIPENVILEKKDGRKSGGMRWKLIKPASDPALFL